MSEVGTAVKTLISEGETDLLAVAKSGWSAVESGLEALAPEVKSDLTALLKELEVDLEGGDSVDSLVTDLLNMAESSGKTLVLQVSSTVLSGLVAALIAAL